MKISLSISERPNASYRFLAPTGPEPATFTRFQQFNKMYQTLLQNLRSLSYSYLPKCHSRVSRLLRKLDCLAVPRVTTKGMPFLNVSWVLLTERLLFEPLRKCFNLILLSRCLLCFELLTALQDMAFTMSSVFIKKVS